MSPLGRGHLAEVESLYLMWRTTKLQIYRNWGQRLLAAFYRRKTHLACCEARALVDQLPQLLHQPRFIMVNAPPRPAIDGCPFKDHSGTSQFWSNFKCQTPFLPGGWPREYGFSSLHNVNKPSSKRDDMSSFFMAETLKRLGGTKPASTGRS